MIKSRFVLVALAAAASIWSMAAAQAGCIISPDQKSINVIADNPSTEEKNCSIKCQVDTKIGTVQVSCGGTTPPLAKAHSLCDYDKPEPWYKKVISSEDSCKASADAAPAKAPKQETRDAASPAPTCRISADGKTLEALIANPYKIETSCQMDCKASTTNAGTTFAASCTRNAAPGVGEVVLCAQTYDKGRLVKVLSVTGACIDPTPAKAAADDDDDDVDVQSLASDPAKIREQMRKQLPPDARKMFDSMNKP